MKPTPKPPVNGAKRTTGVAPVSPRQAQIACLVARGLTDKEIAAELRISEETVGFHLRRLFERLQVHSRSALVHQCVSPLHERVACQSRRGGVYWS